MLRQEQVSPRLYFAFSLAETCGVRTNALGESLSRLGAQLAQPELVDQNASPELRAVLVVADAAGDEVESSRIH